MNLSIAEQNTIACPNWCVVDDHDEHSPYPANHVLAPIEVPAPTGGTIGASLEQCYDRSEKPSLLVIHDGKLVCNFELYLEDVPAMVQALVGTLAAASVHR